MMKMLGLILLTVSLIIVIAYEKLTLGKVKLVLLASFIR